MTRRKFSVGKLLWATSLNRAVQPLEVKMEFFFEILAELICQIVAEVTLGGIDWVSWKRGRPNRIERRQAKRDGHDLPKRDKWNWLTTILTPIVVILGALILISLVVKLS